MYVRPDGLAAVLVSDSEYPQRVGHTLLVKVLDDVSAQTDWKTANTETLRNYKGKYFYFKEVELISSFSWKYFNGFLSKHLA